MMTSLLEEEVGLSQATKHPVIPNSDYPCSKVFLLFGEGVLHGVASCPPLQSRPSSSSSPSISSCYCEACVVLQGVLHQHHTVLHRWLHLDASPARELRCIQLTGRGGRFSVILGDLIILK